MLQENSAEVARVATGELATAQFKKRFGSVTGKEAFRPDAYSEPYLRPTYEVYVEIDHDRRSPRKFRVFTAYPRNEWAKK